MKPLQVRSTRKVKNIEKGGKMKVRSDEKEAPGTFKVKQERRRAPASGSRKRIFVIDFLSK